jgi:DNA-binding CsgD family transcriptional regulator
MEATGSSPFGLAAGLHQTTALAVCALAMALADGGDRRAAQTYATGALAESERTSDKATSLIALRALGVCAVHAGRLHEAVAYFRKRRILSDGDPECLASEIAAMQLTDDFSGSMELLEAVGRDRRVTHPLHVAEMMHHYLTGSLRQAKALATTIAGEAEHAHDDQAAFPSRLILGRIAHLQGDYQLARRCYTAASRTALHSDDWFNLLGVAKASLALAEGDHADAAKRFRDLLRTTPVASSVRDWVPSAIVDAIRAATASNDLALANDVASIARAIAEATPDSVTIAGVNAQAQGLITNDPRGLRSAVDLLQVSPRPATLADAWFDYGRCLIGNGQSVAGTTALERAFELFTSIDADGEAAHVDRLLIAGGARRRSVKPVHRPKDGWASLTLAERRVAELLADGYSNREAAAHLGLTHNTIGTHARSIFGKLGVRSRVELTRTAVQEMHA